MFLMIITAWAVPFVWAIAVAHARHVVRSDDITALAVGMPVLFFGLGFLLMASGGSDGWSPWDIWILAAVPGIAFYAFSWIAVIWAHIGVSYKPSIPPRGFPIVPIQMSNKSDEV